MANDIPVLEATKDVLDFVSKGIQEQKTGNVNPYSLSKKQELIQRPKSKENGGIKITGYTQTVNEFTMGTNISVSVSGKTATLNVAGSTGGVSYTAGQNIDISGNTINSYVEVVPYGDTPCSARKIIIGNGLSCSIEQVTGTNFYDVTISVTGGTATVLPYNGAFAVTYYADSHVAHVLAGKIKSTKGGTIASSSVENVTLYSGTTRYLYLFLRLNSMNQPEAVLSSNTTVSNQLGRWLVGYADGDGVWHQVLYDDAMYGDDVGYFLKRTGYAGQSTIDTKYPNPSSYGARSFQRNTRYVAEEDMMLQCFSYACQDTSQTVSVILYINVSDNGTTQGDLSSAQRLIVMPIFTDQYQYTIQFNIAIRKGTSFCLYVPSIPWIKEPFDPNDGGHHACRILPME